MDLLAAHGSALDVFDAAVHAVGPGGWTRGTPCTGWSVRDLVNHLTAEQLWVPHLLAGATLDEVGSRYDGDVLGDDPLPVWEKASAAAREAWLSPGALRRTVHVSFGLAPAEEYGWQMTIDLAVHDWDVAIALGRPNPVPDGLAARLLDVLRPMIDDWQGSGCSTRRSRWAAPPRLLTGSWLCWGGGRAEGHSGQSPVLRPLPLSAQCRFDAPNATFGASHAPNATFGAPHPPNATFGASHAPNATFGAPHPPNATFGAPHPPNATLGCAAAHPSSRAPCHRLILRRLSRGRRCDEGKTGAGFASCRGAPARTR